MAKEMQDVNESRFNPARAIAASAPTARILVVEDEAALSMPDGHRLGFPLAGAFTPDGETCDEATAALLFNRSFGR